LSEPNDELLQRVLNDQGPTFSPEQRFRHAVSRWIEGRKNLHTVSSTLLALVGLALLFRGGAILQTGLLMQRTELIANGSLMSMLGLGALFFDKLWFRIASNHAFTQQQLLLLRSDLSHLCSERRADEPKVGSDTNIDPMLSEGLHDRLTSFWSAVSNRTIQRISVAVVLVGAVVAGLTLTRPPRDPSRITQVDEWQIVAGDVVSARSTIEFQQPPERGHFVTLALPYSTGNITSIEANGQHLPFEKLDWRRIEVELPIGSYPWRPFEILVSWEFSVGCLAPVEDGYRTTLSPLLPVSSYRLEVVADDESGYEILGQPAVRRLVPFNSGTQLEEEAFFGSCHIGVRKTVSEQSPLHSND
jgi:hypothetical protein